MVVVVVGGFDVLPGAGQHQLVGIDGRPVWPAVGRGGPDPGIGDAGVVAAVPASFDQGQIVDPGARFGRGGSFRARAGWA